MNTSIARTLSGAIVAAAAMYLLDPSSGRRRRARLRDRLVSAAADLRAGVDAGGRDLAHRVKGMAARVRSANEDDPVDDAVLAERVRASLGRAVSHPGAIEVDVAQCRVFLSGAVLAQEYRQLMDAVQSVRGVEEIEDALAVYERPTGISALQGGRPRRPPRFELLQESWSPAARLVTGAAGAGLLLAGVTNRRPLGIAGAIAGSVLLLRSATNAPLGRLLGAAGRRVVDVRKTIHVNAPIEQVFETLSFYENLPLFMRNVRNVRMHSDGRSHWRVAGPGGVNVEWDAVTTQFEPNRLIAWRTVPHSTVQHAGALRFEPENGGTRLDIQMSYNPPGGILGHAVAKLFGSDPKSELDQDLLRLKSFLETGKPPHDAAAHETAAYMSTETPAPTRAAGSADTEPPMH